MLKKYIGKRLTKALDWVKPVDWDNWNMNKITLGIEFFPISYNGKTKIAFIPTGSKDKPAGISTLTDDFILFFDPEKVGSPFYYHIDDIKLYMSDNFDKISASQKIDRDFNHLGYEIDLRDFIASCEKTPSVVTSPSSLDS
jgi:hypothetical protein